MSEKIQNFIRGQGLMHKTEVILGILIQSKDFILARFPLTPTSLHRTDLPKIHGEKERFKKKAHGISSSFLQGMGK